MMAGEQDLRRLAGKQTKRRDIADRIAGQKRCEGPSERKRGARRHAPAPAFGANDKPETGEGEDEDEAPADALDGLDDVSDARAAHRVHEERGPGQGSGYREEMPAAHAKSQNPTPKPQTPTATKLGFGAWELGFGIFARVSVRLACFRAA